MPRSKSSMWPRLWALSSAATKACRPTSSALGSHVGPVAADQPIALEPAYALEHGRCGEAECVGQAGVGLAAVSLQGGEDLAVESVHGRPPDAALCDHCGRRTSVASTIPQDILRSS